MYYSSTIIFFSYELLSIGDNVFIGSKAHFSAFLTIGNYVMFGPGVYILGGDHLFGVIGKSVRFLKPKENENAKDIIIEDEVWCGSNTVILKGVTLGMGCVIGAGSIVSKSVPPYTIAVGNPCKPVKKIFTNAELQKHMQLLGYPSNLIQQIIRRRKDLLEKDGLNQIKYYKTFTDLKKPR